MTAAVSGSQYILRVHALKLPVRLGCGEEERSQAQWVEWDVDLHFSARPRACDSDDLAHTLCYDQISRLIASVCERKPYHLLEHLADEAARAIRPHLLSVSQLRLRVRKLKPPIPYETQGTSFEWVEGF
jgi:dihydroneopterin aldolase